MVNEVTIRIGGESGEGTISGGDILALAAARWGYHVYTFRTFPAEILGGPCLFQVRISDQHVKSMGDYPDVLICLNQEAYDRNIGDLRHGGDQGLALEAGIPQRVRAVRAEELAAGALRRRL